MPPTSPPRVALLIDADNVLNHIEQILKISEQYGQLTLRRAYGDWNKPPLSSSRKKIRAFNIKIVQQDRIGKEATDYRMMIDTGKLLGANQADVFVIVSGDGDFTLLCGLIKQHGKEVIGIGNRKHASKDLQESCSRFHCIEDLEKELSKREKARLDKAEKVQLEAIKKLLNQAFRELPCDEEGWLDYGPLGQKLRELDPTFKKRFGDKRTSIWLKQLDAYFQSRDQRVRKIDSESTKRINLMRQAYYKTRQADGRANLGQLWQALRELDPKFESRFGEKRPITWLCDYPHIFTVQQNYVWLV